MAIKLTNDQVFYAFEPGLTPAAHAALGEEVTLITRDCFADQLASSDDTLDALDWDYINPATGPVYFDGVRAGDLLRIYIKQLRPTGHAVVTPIPGEGVMGDRITQGETIIVQNAADHVVVPTRAGELKLSARPMLGVIGVAPASGKVPNGTPGAHGGNMDCTLVAENTSLYFRVGVDGALFGCGDAHTVMGDGEVLVCGAETPTETVVVADVVDEPDLPAPFLENETLYAVMASAGTTDAAYKLACDLMLDFLTKVAGLHVNDAAMLMSLCGDLKFCQVVDPQVTVRFEFPKQVLVDLGFTGIGS
ncbi:MAG: acetamidase/formamidase family protein [Actinomycetes bacterium]|jgi:amidase|nr:acetamidase/formamidase family protein [Actinomycetes bacterium]